MIEFLTPDAYPRDWHAMWEALNAAVGDFEDVCPQTGERWQYMGTVDGRRHQFRHRHRPSGSRAITGHPGHHVGRVYIDLDCVTLRVTRVNSAAYSPDRIPAGIATSRALGQRTAAGREQNRIDAQRRDYGGAFDGTHVVSDADPGL